MKTPNQPLELTVESHADSDRRSSAKAERRSSVQTLGAGKRNR